jgi:hypothetical protein
MTAPGTARRHSQIRRVALRKVIRKTADALGVPIPNTPNGGNFDHRIMSLYAHQNTGERWRAYSEALRRAETRMLLGRFGDAA